MRDARQIGLHPLGRERPIPRGMYRLLRCVHRGRQDTHRVHKNAHNLFSIKKGFTLNGVRVRGLVERMAMRRLVYKQILCACKRVIALHVSLLYVKK